MTPPISPMGLMGLMRQKGKPLTIQRAPFHEKIAPPTLSGAFVREIMVVRAGDAAAEEAEESSIFEFPGRRRTRPRTMVEVSPKQRSRRAAQLLRAGSYLPVENSVRKLLVASQKGGVGRTTTSINLAAAAALAETRVLLLDADPLSSVSAALNLENH